MKAVAALALVLLLSGCASVSGSRGSRLLPWNWLAPDSTAKIEDTTAKRDAAGDDLRELAQQFIAAADRALDAEKLRQAAAGSAPSNETTVAGDMVDRAGDALGKSEGALSPERVRAAEQMVLQLTSQLAAERAAGAATLAKLDRTTADASQIIDRATARLAELEKDNAAEKQRALAAEARLNKFWFFAYCMIGGWALLQLLPLLSAVFPVLAPVAKVAGMVLAPAVQAGANRVKAAVGSALRAAEGISKEAAYVARAELDAPLSAADQSEIARAYKLTP